MAYQPRQKDIVWINFNPSKGHEIQKRRPALIVSSDDYNHATHFVIVCPITNTKRKLKTHLRLKGYQTTDQVMTQQMYSLDVTEAGGREIQYIERLSKKDFHLIKQLIQYNFDF
ncbi:type II toxin-antitoxin system PemK/MazF family toxin [Aerococcus mictus]|uniref:type II toxin-antitoxin system PemK/MazF family toxin n=1 Tax=Aerococcus mictus TaxID=2976810 RepID=UPI002278D6BC|nr:type II toxin-antitoxin system PemK/MazF family toxin [Aerococcus mictus]MCY3085522.1 type II toxin-antitoxin system PemK/MazF family toxin [Aerococcus mictus]